jgi:hypothetical protein
VGLSELQFRGTIVGIRLRTNFRAHARLQLFARCDAMPIFEFNYLSAASHNIVPHVRVVGDAVGSGQRPRRCWRMVRLSRAALGRFLLVRPPEFAIARARVHSV